MANDTTEIRLAAEHFLRVFDALQWEPFTECWSSNPSAFFPHDNSRSDGREAVLARFRTLFDRVPRSSGPPYLHLNPKDLRIDRYGDAGLVTFLLGDAPHPMALRTLLFIREAGAWKLAHVHATHFPSGMVLD